MVSAPESINSPDAIVELAEFARGVDFSGLSAEVMAATHVELLDTVGCALGGNRIVDRESLLAVAGGARPGNAASIWGTNALYAAPDAALINGTVGHALEFDDTHDTGALHVGVTVIPAVVAAAESIGASGVDTLSGIVGGIEVAARLAMASTVGPGVSGWLLTPLCGYFGAAAGAGRVLGLTHDQMINALGLAYAQTAGNGQATLDGGETKRMQAGLAARGGLLSALLARGGVTAARRVLEGPRGYYSVYHAGAYDGTKITEGLTDTYEVAALSLKPYPCCRWTHAAIEAAFELRGSGVDPSAIDRVDVVVNQQSYNSTGSDPERRQRPTTPIEAQFSIPYVFAVAYSHGRVTLNDFQPVAIGDQSTLALARRVFPAPAPATDAAAARNLSGAAVTITATDGRSFSATIDAPSRLRPGADALGSVGEKFLELCEFGGVERSWAIEMRERLTHLDAVDVITQLLPIAAEGVRAS